MRHDDNPHNTVGAALRGALSALLLFGCACLTTGCQQKMAAQPSYKPLTDCEFFPDGRAARQPPAGTVARGHLQTDVAFFTGRRTRPSPPPVGAAKGKKKFDENANFVDEFPLPVDEQTIRHGYHRFMIYCVVCHDPLGTGRGKIVERGYTPPPSYHIERLRQAPVGRLFAVVSEGYGSMPSYGSQIPPRDRWAIVAYVRALQLSQHFPEDELTEDMRQAMAREKTTPQPELGNVEQAEREDQFPESTTTPSTSGDESADSAKGGSP